MKIKCKIGDKNDTWVEELEVKNLETAERDIRDIIKWFNSDLRPGENSRKFISLLDEKVDTSSLGYMLEIVNEFIDDLNRENNNAYGNAWVKSVMPRIYKSYEKLLSKGKSNSVKNYMKKALYNVRDISDELVERIKTFLDTDIDNLIKIEQNKQENSE